MKINYHVLWFDDQLNNIEGYKRSLQRIVSNLGFQLQVDTQDEISSSIISDLKHRLSIYNPYDLILFDHDMGHNKIGASYAAELRASVFTDMVYYSATSPAVLRKSLYDNQVDGVFIAHRDSFEEDLSGIISDHIKKICDLNNMRGLVLDFMSYIDVKLRETLLKEIQDSPNKDAFLTKIQGLLLCKKKGVEKALSTLSLESLCDVVSNSLFADFNLIRFCLAHFHKNQFKVFSQTLDKMQDIRNALAHQPYSINPENNMVSVLIKNQISEFDFERFIEIRKNLIFLKNEIEKL